MRFTVQTVGRCEWPDGCRVQDADLLHAHHIYGRGMGGGKRDDHPEKVAALCGGHHNLGSPCAHDSDHWNRPFQDRLQRHIQKSRSLVTWRILWAYMEAKDYPIG